MCHAYVEIKMKDKKKKRNSERKRAAKSEKQASEHLEIKKAINIWEY